ncbi:MAG: RHS repeat-associated core domain-containing protein [Specibacter sp.]
MKAISDGGEIAVIGDETCTATTYADNSSSNLLGLVATTTTFSGVCSSSGGPVGDVLTAATTLYDASTSAAPGSTGYAQPTLGNVARVDTATSVSGTTVTQWLTGPTTTYDILGRATKVVDTSTGTARTNVTTFTPSTGLPITVKSTNPLNWVTTTTLDAVRGQETMVVDANGSTTSSRYDASGRITGSWDPMRPQSTNATPSVATTYMVSQTAPSWVRTDKVNNLGSVVASYEIYDGLGRARQTQRLSPGGGTIATDSSYNSAGLIRLERHDYYMSGNPTGTLMLPSLAVPSSTKYGYDAAGRQNSVTALTNDNTELWSTNATYVGSDTVISTGPGEQSATKGQTDMLGNITKRLTYHGTDASGTADAITYSYDALGQLTDMTDQVGNKWVWTYDAAGRKKSATDPDTGTQARTYDSSGRTTSVTDELGNVTGYTYDTLDRITTQTAKTGTGAPRTFLSNVYDGEKKGQPTSVTRYNGPNFDQPVTTTVAGYNAANQPSTKTLTLPTEMGTFAGTYTTQQTYKANGLVASVRLPAVGGLAAEWDYYGYDEFDNPSSIDTQKFETIAGDTQYTHLGQISTFNQYDKNAGNATGATTGTTRTYFAWDATTGRLSGQNSTNNTQGKTADLGAIAYTYNESGALTARRTSYDSRPNAPVDNQCYTYDHANRLAAVWTPLTPGCTGAPTPTSTSVAGLGGPAPYAQTYQYNENGDRSQTKRFASNGALAVTETATYPSGGSAGPHRVQTVVSASAIGEDATETYGWNTAGQMTNRSGQTLTYTVDGLLQSSSGTSTAPDNPNPNAAVGTAPGSAATSGMGTRFYDGGGNLVGIVDTTGTTVAIGSRTAYSPAAGSTGASATGTYSFAGKSVAQRTLAGGVQKLTFIISDSVNTAQTLINPTDGVAGVIAVTRFVDPMGLPRGPTLMATAANAYVTAPGNATGGGSNAANPVGFGSINGYISGLADAASGLLHLGARELNQARGIFTTPDPVLDLKSANNLSAYQYAEADPVNASDPSGLRIAGPSERFPQQTVGQLAKQRLQGIQAAQVWKNGPISIARIYKSPILSFAFSPEVQAVLKRTNDFFKVAVPVVGTIAAVGCVVATGGGCLVGGAMIAGATSLASTALESNSTPADYAKNAAVDMAIGFIPGGKIASAGKLGLAAPARQAAQVLAKGTKGGIGPVLKGQAGVDQVAAGIEAAGGKILGREITVEAGGVRSRMDLYAELPCGTVCFIEVKNGWWARLTKNQTTVFPLVRTQPWVAYGQNAIDANLIPGKIYGPISVWEVWLNKW